MILKTLYRQKFLNQVIQSTKNMSFILIHFLLHQNLINILVITKFILFQQNQKQSRRIQSKKLNLMYIGQQLKNTQYKQKRNRRISSILSEIRFMSEDDKQYPNNKLQQIDIINSQFKSTKRKSKLNHSKKSSLMVQELVVDVENKKRNQHHKRQSSNEFRIKHKNRRSKLSQLAPNKESKSCSKSKIQCKQSSLTTPTSSIVPSSPILRKFPISKIPKKSSQLFRQSSSLFKERILCQEPMDLQQQNIHKLNSFIRGAYDNELNQYSDVVNLTMIDKIRRQFYVFNRLYEEIAEANLSNKMTIRDVQEQNLKDIVFMNEQKDHATAPEYRTALKQLKIIR